MTDESDDEMERWLLDTIVPAAGNLENAANFAAPADDAGRLPTDDDDTLREALIRRKHVADLLRTTQPTRIAPPEWADKVLEVVTESGSRYVIDTLEWTLQRMRGRDDQEDLEVAPASVLRRDGEVLRLLRVIELEVGHRGIFDVEPLRPDAIWTRRTTTFVMEIRIIGSTHDGRDR